MRQTEKPTILPAVKTINGTPAPLENVSAASITRNHRQVSSDGSSGERSDMMSLINASANLLFDTMDAQQKNDPYTVQNVCKCAQQIKELMRLKLDMIKMKSGY